MVNKTSVNAFLRRFCEVGIALILYGTIIFALTFISTIFGCIIFCSLENENRAENPKVVGLKFYITFSSNAMKSQEFDIPRRGVASESVRSVPNSPLNNAVSAHKLSFMNEL